MGHYARFDEKKIIQEVIVADEEFIGQLPDREQWVKTSYNTYKGKRFDPSTGQYIGKSEDEIKNFASIGSVLRKDGNTVNRPFPSWKYDNVLGEFIPPVPMPKLLNNQQAFWNEDELKWDISTFEGTAENNGMIDLGYSIEKLNLNPSNNVRYTDSGYYINEKGYECDPNTGEEISITPSTFQKISETVVYDVTNNFYFRRDTMAVCDKDGKELVTILDEEK